MDVNDPIIKLNLKARTAHIADTTTTMEKGQTNPLYYGTHPGCNKSFSKLQCRERHPNTHIFKHIFNSCIFKQYFNNYIFLHSFISE